MISRYNYRPYRSSYRLQAEARTEKQIRTYKKLVTKIRNDLDKLDDMTEDLYPDRRDKHDKEVRDEVYSAQSAMYRLYHHLPD